MGINVEIGLISEPGMREAHHNRQISLCYLMCEPHGRYTITVKNIDIVSEFCFCLP
jgi:hypothetical protein